jgi:hypothetical protein
MKRHLIRAVTLAIGIALLAAVAAIAKPKTTARVEKFEAGNIVAIDHGGISPEKLPQHRQAPIAGHIHGRFSTKDGSHLPAIDRLTVDFDRTLQVNAKGLPSCSAADLTARGTASAKRVCSDAIVGSGSGEVEIAFPEQAPIMVKTPLVAFNGGVHGGKTLLFVHAYITVPTPAAVVAEAQITKVNDGHYGMHTVTKVPRIAGGAGSVTRVDLNLGRKFTYKGRQESYLTASCPAGRYFIRGALGFADGTLLHISHILPCTPEA